MFTKKVVFDGIILYHGIEELHPGFPYSDGHFRAVLEHDRGSGHDSDVYNFYVEREGFRDAMNQTTWVVVKGESRQKILAQVGVIMAARQTVEVDRLSSILNEQAHAKTVTVPGAAVGEPPKS